MKLAIQFLILPVSALLIWFTYSNFYIVEAVQRGYPGVAMENLYTRPQLAQIAANNVVPPSLPPAPPGGQLSVDAYKNVQVLGHINTAEMTRLMTAMSTWVTGGQGCSYCHVAEKDANGNPKRDEEGYLVVDNNALHLDDLYTKRVARKMLQMTMYVNSGYQSHVQNTGVTCYTCHRGNPVPQYIWFSGEEEPLGMVGNRAGQNRSDPVVAYASLPSDVFTAYLLESNSIKVHGEQALPGENRASIKMAEHSYGLMMHMSSALGVNCTYCHNTRSMADWSTSPPQRATAWYGVRMVRSLNNDWLAPLNDTLPPNRLGVLGDAPKANCSTCHQGAYKPLLGVSMLKDYPVLAQARVQPPKTPPPEEVPPVEGAPPAEGAVPVPAPVP